MHTNADNLLNKLNELEIFLKCQLYKPHIIAVTEAKPKKFSGQIRPSEFHLDGYTIFYEGVSEDNFSGTVVYISKDLTVTQMEPNIPFRECLLIRIEMAVGDNVIFGTFYQSPNSNSDNDSELL